MNSGDFAYWYLSGHITWSPSDFVSQIVPGINIGLIEIMKSHGVFFTQLPVSVLLGALCRTWRKYCYSVISSSVDYTGWPNGLVSTVKRHVLGRYLIWDVTLVSQIKYRPQVSTVQQIQANLAKFWKFWYWTSFSVMTINRPKVNTVPTYRFRLLS